MLVSMKLLVSRSILGPCKPKFLFYSRQQERSAATWYNSPKPLSVIGFPFAGGQPKSGVEESPSELKKGFGRDFEGIAWTELELSPTDRQPNAVFPREKGKSRNTVAVVKATEKLREELVGRGGRERSVVVGGDHSMAIGSVAASLRLYPQLQVVWIDAHADVNLSRHSPSGNMHGMPLAVLTEVEKGLGGGYVGQTSPLHFQRIHYFGLRSVDEMERALLRAKGVSFPTVAEIENIDNTTLLGRLLPNHPTHVSFDVDVIAEIFLHFGTGVECLEVSEPHEFPCTGTPVKGGLKLERTLDLLTHLLANFNVVSVDLVEINLKEGNSTQKDISLRATSRILNTLLLNTPSKWS